jgi:hypothetical protein
MKRTMRTTTLILFVLCLAPLPASAQSFSTVLSGANEFPGPGDSDGTGLAVVTINGTTVRYTIFAQGIGPVTAAHIHRGAAGIDGPPIVNFDPTFSGGGATGSVPGITQSVINEIIANPAGYYVNVHTTEFPNGAIRGQLVGGGAGQEGPSTCVPTDTVMCLTGNRFRLEATWTAPDGQTGPGHAVELREDSGYFWFFNPDNIEMTVKTLNACGPFPNYWVFASGLTNVQVILKVTDTTTGGFKTYTNPQGLAFQPIQDTAAFACP